MESSVRPLVRALIAGAAVTAWLLPAAAVGGQRTAGSAPGLVASPARATSTAAPAGYVGEKTCLSCHQEQAAWYYKTPHGRALNPASPIATQGCESCHGAGQAHVDASGDKSKIRTFKSGMTPREISGACVTCHAAGEFALWEGSAHESRNVSCLTCHTIHKANGGDGAAAARQLAACARCHRAQVQKMQRTSHMPVAEGKLACSSCHNPHGATNEKLLKTGETVNDACESCHADKRGPHLWEHAPVVESCTTCHDPHGSTNDRMLVAKEPFLCQRCHVTAQHTVTPYEGYVLESGTSSNRMYGRSCAACHQNIHGSNAPSGQAFLR